ncbi:MAG: hypothetical protein ACKVGW_04690 [Verrucomicrobiia bacterium]|jgi:hypothetical protein
MNSPNPRPLSRLATQLATAVLIGSIAYALGYRQGDRSNEEILSSNINVESDPSIPRSQSPTDISEQILVREFSEIHENEENLEPSADWQARGYDAGLAGVEEALLKAQALNRSDQSLFIFGLFTNIAEFSAPRDALTIATAQDGLIRAIALKTLVSEWTKETDSEDSNGREIQMPRGLGMSGTKFGLEVELAAILARSKAEPEITLAWMDAFADSPGRSEIAARLIPGQPDFNPDNAFAITENWTDWEKDRFSKSLLGNWAERNPKELIEILDTMKESENRLLTIEAISASLARQGTAGALDWVEGLANSDERNAGLQAVYEATPKGIGALLSTENGFPKIGEILPGGALESTDIRKGDLIVQSREADGAANDLYGIPLGESVGFLRGAPGSTVEIRVLRKNETTGELEEHSVTVERDLLILDEHK